MPISLIFISALIPPHANGLRAPRFGYLELCISSLGYSIAKIFVKDLNLARLSDVLNPLPAAIF